MLERYHDAMMSTVTTRWLLWWLLRWSAGGVGGMSRRTCCWSAVSRADNLGWLILLVVHFCASTMANWGFVDSDVLDLK